MLKIIIYSRVLAHMRYVMHVYAIRDKQDKQDRAGYAGSKTVTMIEQNQTICFFFSLISSFLALRD